MDIIGRRHQLEANLPSLRVAMIEYFTENKEAIIQVVTAVIAAASAIAALTPTPKDDGLLKKVAKIVDLLALNVFRAKDK